MNNLKHNLNLLTALNALLTEVHVSNAANRIHITQAAMSNALNQLRKILHDDLLVRVSNRMVLTPKAELLKPKIQRLIKQTREIFDDEIYFDPKTSKRTFILGLSDCTSMIVLSRLMPKLKEIAPNIKIEVKVCNHIDSHEVFENSGIDIAIGFFENVSQSLRRQRLYFEDLVCLVNKKNPLAKKKKLTLKDYLNSKHVLVQTSDGYAPTWAEKTLSSAKHEFNIALRLPFHIPALMILTETPYITTIAKWSADILKQYLPLKSFEPPFDHPKCSVYQIWSGKNHQDAAHQWLRKLLYSFKWSD